MKVRYSPVVSGLLLVLGVACLGLGVWDWTHGTFGPGVVIGVLVALMGVLTLTRTYFRVGHDVVEVLAMLGPAKREYPYESLVYDNGRLFAVDGAGERRRIPVARWIAHSGDWMVATDPSRRPAA
jgi:hypothetical protein